jgi:ABC-2 type transport system permease protein
VALLLVVPALLLALVKGIYHDNDAVFQRIGVPLLGVFPLVTMFLVTSIAMLRERTAGTLERLLTTPLSKLDLLAGYAVAFGSLAALQVAVVSAVSFGMLGLDTEGPLLGLLGLALINALLGTAMGLFLSAFATSEFQAVQFMPAFVLPQLLLCGLFTPRDRMAEPLDIAAGFLPLTYAYDALIRVARGDAFRGWLAADTAILGAVMVVALCLGAATLRRRTP